MTSSPEWWPAISPELIRNLQSHFPDKCPALGRNPDVESLALACARQQGQRDVINHLIVEKGKQDNQR